MRVARGAPARRARAGRLAAVDLLTLAAVSGVVLLVSLPCLRDFAVRENERDACALLPVLTQVVNRPAHRALEPLELAPLLERAPALARELRDARPGADGTLRHHGYVFAVAAAGPDGRRAVLAWPLEHGRTGLHGFAFRPGEGLFLHPNPEGRWSGERGPAGLLPGEGWEPAR